MKSSVIIVCLGVAACGGTTNGAQCGAGTALVNGQCVVASMGAGGGAAGSGAAGSGAAGSGAEPEAGPVDGQAGGTSGDSGTPSIVNATPITWSSSGWLGGNRNPFGIEGWWWADNDCKQATAANLPCDEPDPTLVGPGGAHGWSLSSEQACLKGTLEAITDWTFQWGADMGFGLTVDHTPYDASAIKGFAFDIIGTAPSTVRIVVAMPDIKNQYYREVPVPSVDARAVFTGPDAVAQSPEITGVDKVTFDPTHLTDVFFVPGAQLGTPVPYDFCIRNVRVLQ